MVPLILDPLGQERHPVRVQPRHLGGELLATEIDEVELDGVDEAQERLGPGREAKVIERHVTAGLLELGDHGRRLRFTRLRLHDLDDHPPRQQRVEAAIDQLARNFDPGAACADDPLEADLGQCIEHDARGRGLLIFHERAIGAPVAEQQLVADDVHPPIEDRLTSDVNVVHC